MRAAAVVAGAGLLLLAAPGTASADVIFDPAGADELATVLAEATTDQNVCYGWDVQVSDAVAGQDSSIGSNFGAGQPVTSGTCRDSVELKVYITYTSESSESEDSASYDVSSTPGGPTRDDLAALELDTDGLTGENPDVVIGKMVVALPLLAADKGLAPAIEAAPQTGAAPADAKLTDNPGSDWWRNNGGMLLWGVGFLLAGGIFAWWVLKTNRRYRPSRRSAPVERIPTYIPDTVPTEFYDQQPTTPVPAQPQSDAEPTQPVSDATIEKAAATGRSTPDKPTRAATPESATPDEPTAGRTARSTPGEPATGTTSPTKPTGSPEKEDAESSAEPEKRTQSPSEEAGPPAAATPPSAESAEPSSDQANLPDSESAADQKDKE